MEGDKTKDHLVKHQYQKGKSGNPSGKPPGTPTKRTIIRNILDVKVRNKDVIMEKLRDIYPDYFAKSQANRTVEEILWTIHVCQGMFEPKATDVRIDIFNRIHGKPLQAVVTLDDQKPPDEQMTSDQTKEALAYIQAVRHNFQAAKEAKERAEDEEE